MGIPQNGWFIRETPKIDDLGYPYFRKPPYSENNYAPTYTLVLPLLRYAHLSLLPHTVGHWSACGVPDEALST